KIIAERTLSTAGVPCTSLPKTTHLRVGRGSGYANLLRVSRQHFVRPVDEVLHVGAIFMAAVVLAPGEFALEQSSVHGRHFGGAIVLFFTNVFRAKQPEHRPGGDGGHVASLLI